MTSDKPKLSPTDRTIPEEVIKTYKDLDQKIEEVLKKIKNKRSVKKT